MYIMLLSFWLVLNGRITAEIIILGALVSAALYFFSCKFLGFSIAKDKIIIKEIPLIIGYIFNLVIEIIKSFALTTALIFKKGQPESSVIKFKSGLKSETARVLLANSITLTPGTITIDLTDDVYTIHCLKKEFGEGMENSGFVKRLRRMEEVAGL